MAKMTRVKMLKLSADADGIRLAGQCYSVSLDEATALIADRAAIPVDSKGNAIEGLAEVLNAETAEPETKIETIGGRKVAVETAPEKPAPDATHPDGWTPEDKGGADATALNLDYDGSDITEAPGPETSADTQAPGQRAGGLAYVRAVKAGLSPEKAGEVARKVAKRFGYPNKA